VQKKTHHLGIEMLQNRDSGSRIDLNGEQECFGREMGTHNVWTISSAGKRGKKAGLPKGQSRRVADQGFPAPQCEISVLS
jgi:hypothetical protein